MSCYSVDNDDNDDDDNENENDDDTKFVHIGDFSSTSRVL